MVVYERNRTPGRRNMNVLKQKKYLFMFDEKGEYKTDDAAMCEKLKAKFRYDQIDSTKTETPVIAEVAETAEPAAESTPMRHCKKCDFVCETQGQLLKHYREKHKAVKE